MATWVGRACRVRIVDIRESGNRSRSSSHGERTARNLQQEQLAGGPARIAMGGAAGWLLSHSSWVLSAQSLPYSPFGFVTSLYLYRFLLHQSSPNMSYSLPSSFQGGSGSCYSLPVILFKISGANFGTSWRVFPNEARHASTSFFSCCPWLASRRERKCFRVLDK